MKVKVDFCLNRRFGAVERLIFSLVLNGYSNAREIRLSLPIFSDAVIANAIRHLVNEQIISTDIETGTLSISEAVIAIISTCQERSFEIAIPSVFKDIMSSKGIEICDNELPEAIELKNEILQELLPNVKLDSYRYSLDFVITQQNGGVDDEQPIMD